MNQHATVGIIGAMEPEIRLLKSSLTDLQTHQFGELEIYTGYLNGCRVALSLSGIGKVNAAIATALLAEHFQAAYIINTGSAGGIGKSIAVGDVVIGTQTAHHDVDVTAFGYQIGQVPQLPARFDSNAALIQLAQQAATVFNDANIHQGLIVSGDQFIHDSSAIETIRHHFPDVAAVEMEAAAIAQACMRLQIPYVVIRAISDAADEQADISFEAFIEQAGKQSAQMVTQIIDALHTQNTA